MEGTEALGEALGALVVAGDVIALDGDLGAGKTAFVRGLARGLGVPGDIASPTYILMDAYEGGRVPLYHFDAWMEGREKALFLDGGDEWLSAGGVAVVEWAARVLEWLPLPRLAVRLGHLSLEARSAELLAEDGSAPGHAPRDGAETSPLGLGTLGLGPQGLARAPWGPRLAALAPPAPLVEEGTP